MSFLYDEQVLEELSKAIANKTAQQIPQPVFSPRQMKNVALELLGNIKQSFSPIQIENNAQLFTKNLLNIQTLVQWLMTNQAKYSGKLIAKHGLDADDNSYEQYKDLPNTSIWKEGLIGFLQDLQKQAQDSNNAYFAEQVSGLVSAANTELQAGITEKQTNQSSSNQTTQQPSNTTPDQKNTNQPGQQGQPGQGTQIQNVVDQTKQVLQQRGASLDTMPFDLATNQIDIGDIQEFNNSVAHIMQQGDLSPARELRSKWGLLNSQISQISGAINNWNSVATPQARAGGFELSTNTGTQSFVETYANSDYKKARFMLLALIPLIQSTYGLLNTLLASPTLVEMVGGQQTLTNQITRGQYLLTHIQSMISQIETAIKQGS